MSKKKASGSSTTMTLKEFHGGSIPSDLPLPSGPGVIARPSERSGFDRPGSWGNSNGRSDHRLRPGSAGAVRNFNDKTPFLSPSAQIGRNFDEDERKPLGGMSGPRRTVSDENIHALPMPTELKDNYSSTGRLPTSYAARATEANGGANSQRLGDNNFHSIVFSEAANISLKCSNLGGSVGEAVSGFRPNAWAVRKEVVGTTEPLPVAWSGSNAGLKLANASALEKVSSGRWQSKKSIYHQTDSKAMSHTAVESEIQCKSESFHDRSSYPSVNAVGGEDHDLARHAKRSLAVENSPSYLNGAQSAHDDVKIGELPMHSELSERPKLKLLPKTEAIDTLESNVNCKPGSQQPYNYDQMDSIPKLHGNRAHERPKLNLKPRSESLEQLEGDTERKRSTLFGGARPRELVLKDRGIDDVNNDHIGTQPANGQDAPRTETVPKHANPTRYQKPVNIPLENRMISDRNRQSENRKHNWEAQKLSHHQLPQERPPSPEMWRKPAEPPKVASVEVSGLHHGKLASSVELAQTFSRSVSDPKMAHHVPGPRGLSGRAQLPFSRLMDPMARPQINGY